MDLQIDDNCWYSPNHPRECEDSKWSQMDWESPNHPRKNYDLPTLILDTNPRLEPPIVEWNANRLIDLWEREKEKMNITVHSHFKNWWVIYAPLDKFNRSAPENGEFLKGEELVNKRWKTIEGPALMVQVGTTEYRIKN